MSTPFTFLLQPRWADMDALHHVNNARYVDYAQEARLGFFVDGMGLDAQRREPVVVVRQEIDYLHPLVHRGRPVAVDVEVAAIGNTSFTLIQTIRDPELDGLVYARVRAVLVGFDRTTESSRPLNAAERAGLTARLGQRHGQGQGQ